MHIAKDFDERVNLRGGVVKIKAGASGRSNAESFHQWLIAVVATAQRDAALIGNGHQVVGMDSIEKEADQTGPANGRAKEADAAHAGKFFKCVGRAILCRPILSR